MEHSPKFDSIQPRFLRYRSHYKIYILFFAISCLMLCSYWGLQFTQSTWKELWADQKNELSATLAFHLIFGCFYFFWLRYKLNRSVQVFSDYILIHNSKEHTKINYEDVESASPVYWSLFYIKTKDGQKHFFNSGLDRVDYVWEGLKNARPDLISDEVYEEFKLKLVQYDHHQKRKEWFFKHKFVDALNWVGLPIIFLFVAYLIQSRDVLIYQPGMYFFRLFLYSILILLITNFIFSMFLKKLIFDRKIAQQMIHPSPDKVRDLEYEGVVLQRTKLFQMFSACFLFSFLIQTDFNLYSVTKVKEQLSHFELNKGKTIMVDNRFNCINCRYQINDGDLVLFGRGHFGQIMAKEGDFVGQIAQDKTGRMIASENVQEVPRGHVAVKSANGKDILFVKLQDLVGKIKK